MKKVDAPKTPTPARVIVKVCTSVPQGNGLIGGNYDPKLVKGGALLSELLS